MDRRNFLSISALSLASLALPGCLQAKKKIRDERPVGGGLGSGDKYSVVILGDTHFDTEPASVYHSNYNEPTQWLNDVQRAEFARNGEMWRERCPRLLKRAACLVDDDTKFALQVGDLIQGDCGNGEVHKKMLCDVMDRFKGEFGGLPFVTVVGNHDIRGVDAEKAYHEFMPARMSSELGKEITKTTFSFNIGDDAFIVLDFNKPDDAEIEKLLSDTRSARNTFIITHGPLFPYDASDGRWFFHGSASHDSQRRHFRAEFAQRNAICLCGHVHTTEYAYWKGDGGSIAQMTMSSVWAREAQGSLTVDTEKPADYGMSRVKNDPNVGDQALFDEYRSGLRKYFHSPSVGSYKMTVDGRKVYIDFYAGDSTTRSRRFELR